VTVWGYTDDATISPRVSRYTAGVLRRLGYRVRVRLIPHSFAGVTPREFSTIQLITGAWLDTRAYSFIAPWLTCGGAINHGWFCRPRLDREMRRANSLAVDARAAARLWARIDRELVDQAPWVPLVNPRLIDFVSARVRNYQFHPYWGILADQLWIE
jgi:peptide/nickel transport system substrate-binding protein